MEFAQLQQQGLKVGRAWAIKETLRKLWDYLYPEAARKFWKQWYFWATHSRLKPVLEAAKTLQRHIDNVLTYCQHRITNAVSEGLNSKIQTIKKMAYGFRNQDNFKIAIYFHCGGLDLYPC
jgi:transposase